MHGHIIDSLLLPKVLDEILTRGGTYVIKDIRSASGRPIRATPASRSGPTSRAMLEDILDAIHDHGAVPVDAAATASIEPADMDGAFPEGFYSTTNYRTQVRLGGEWIDVEDQEMDCGILVDAEGEAGPLRRR